MSWGCRGEAKILSGSFLSPDFNSCSLMKISEEIIYPSLPPKVREIYFKKIDLKGEVPKNFESLDDLKSDKQQKYALSN